MYIFNYYGKCFLFCWKNVLESKKNVTDYSYKVGKYCLWSLEADSLDKKERNRAMFFSHILYKTLEHLLKFMKVRARL